MRNVVTDTEGRDNPRYWCRNSLRFLPIIASGRHVRTEIRGKVSVASTLTSGMIKAVHLTAALPTVCVCV